jgi:cytochrome oxidase assembly protein ShyY1
MPEVETEIEKIQAMAWQLQRNLDKLGQQATLTQSAVAASATVTVIEQLVDLFAEKRVLLRTTFAPYLSEA